MRVLRVLGQLVSLLSKNWGRKYCVACNKNVPLFIPHLLVFKQPPLGKALNIIGSDLVNYMCPVCHSHDRERHLILFLTENNFLERFKKFSILHFAPEKNLQLLIASQLPKKYIKADLFPSYKDVKKIDMQDISYEDSTFDLLIANHVLEHVDNDLLALSEIHRVLKIGGYAILQTPFSNQLTKTLDDSGICTDYLRTQINGQPDHLRLYGKDFFERAESKGFEYCPYDAKDNIDSKKYGINPNEVFMLFKKVAI